MCLQLNKRIISFNLEHNDSRSKMIRTIFITFDSHECRVSINLKVSFQAFLVNFISKKFLNIMKTKVILKSDITNQNKTYERSSSKINSSMAFVFKTISFETLKWVKYVAVFS